MTALILRLLNELRPVLPKAVWRFFNKLWWTYFWARERKQTSKELSIRGPKLAGSERAVLIEAIAEKYPFSALIEIGCAYGQNFHILCCLFPEIHLVGIDCNENCISEGGELLAKRGYKNAKLICANGIDLSQFADNSFDIAYTCAALLYVDNRDVEAVISEMLRVARKTVFLVEQHLDGASLERILGNREGWVERHGVLHGEGYWIRDYAALLGRFAKARGCEVRITKIPFPLWTSERWKDFGCLIEIAKGR